MWYIYPMEQYAAMKRNEIGSFVEMWMDLESVIQSEVSQKKKNKYHILMHICGIQKNGTDDLICKAETETQMQRTMYGHKVGWDELGSGLIYIYY